MAKALAKEIYYRFIDIEDLLFPKDNSEYMYLNPRTFEEAESILSNMILESGNFVLVAVRGDFKKEIVSHFKCVIYIEASKEIRVKRVYERSFIQFGKRICEGGDLYEKEQAFFDSVKVKDENTVKNGWPLYLA